MPSVEHAEQAVTPAANLPTTVGVTSPAAAGSTSPVAVASASALAALWSNDPSYPQKLEAVLPLVAAPAGVGVDQLRGAWATAERRRMMALLAGLAQVGVRYRRLGDNPRQGFDCSGFTSWAWSQVGVTLPHQSARQMRNATSKSISAVLPGDLLYYPGHVMMAIGVGEAYVHAPYTGQRVEVRPVMKSRAGRMKVATPI
jgi:cell wall-associated NlpC family hydrolase